MAELFVVLQAREWGQSFWLVASSVVGGLAAMELGLALGAG
jgi:fluoride ion exporter CrcB/FEX